MYTDQVSATKEIYDQHFELWVRDHPTILSDYTARPRVLEILGNLNGLELLDLGCGEGYLARKLAHSGANRVHGIDLSAEMIRAAIKQNERTQLPITYETADLRHWVPVPQTFDGAIGVFLLNYLRLDESLRVLQRTNDALKPQGKLILTLPHPTLPWLRDACAPFYFERPTLPYQVARDHVLSGRIWHRNGDSVPVQCFHKTLEDIHSLVHHAGFRIINVEELYVSEAHLELDRDFFGPLQGTPLHILINAEKPS